MAKIHVSSVDEYIALQPEASQRKLERVRQAIRKALPEAVECISYSIPAFRLNGKVAVYFAGWSEHYSIYPASDAMVAAFEGALNVYRVSKGTLRFALSDPVPTKLIERVAKFRAEEMTRPRQRRSSTASRRSIRS